MVSQVTSSSSNLSDLSSSQSASSIKQRPIDKGTLVMIYKYMLYMYEGQHVMKIYCFRAVTTVMISRSGQACIRRCYHGQEDHRLGLILVLNK